MTRADHAQGIAGAVVLAGSLFFINRFLAGAAIGFVLLVEYFISRIEEGRR